jgi:steroid 5-alpha reductase family enzyme
MPPELTAAFVASAQTIACMMVIVWLLSLILRDASIVDLVWGLGFVLVAWTVFITVPGESVTRWLLVGLTSLWGLRLSVYLARRNLGNPEDFRYQQMRSRRPWFPLTSLYVVFGLQGLVMWVVSLPLQVSIATSQSGWSWLHFVGAAVWATGVSFEAVGDWQLAKFKTNPENAGQVLDTGLWRFTRHPNYFGDFLVWWGLYLVALAQSDAWWTAIGPIVMSIFLMRISGVTLLEKTLRETKPAYAAYVSKTNAFFPAPPKRL